MPCGVLVRLVKRLRSTVWCWTGLSVTGGLGPTKTLAKLATSLGKQREEGLRIL